jgi:hypothetical protein
MSEPAVCGDCGAVYSHKRWTLPDSNSGQGRQKHWRPQHLTVCPACLQQQTGEASGFVHLQGDFYQLHREEIEQLLRHEAERAAEDNPLARIIKWQRGAKHQLTLSTTTEHLAQRLGHALEKAFGGSTRYDFSHENKLARVKWQRK